VNCFTLVLPTHFVDSAVQKKTNREFIIGRLLDRPNNRTLIFADLLGFSLIRDVYLKSASSATHLTRAEQSKP